MAICINALNQGASSGRVARRRGRGNPSSADLGRCRPDPTIDTLIRPGSGVPARGSAGRDPDEPARSGQALRTADESQHADFVLQQGSFCRRGSRPPKPPATWQELRQMSLALTSAIGSNMGCRWPVLLGCSSPWCGATAASCLSRAEPPLRIRGGAASAVGGHGSSRPYSAVRGPGRKADGIRQRPGGDGRRLDGAVAGIPFRLGVRSRHGPLAAQRAGKKRGSHRGRRGGDSGGDLCGPEIRGLEFLTWFTGTQQAARWSRETGYIPVRQSAAAGCRARGLLRRAPRIRRGDRANEVRPRSPAAMGHGLEDHRREDDLCRVR